jgi:hypothetical protein
MPAVTNRTGGGGWTGICTFCVEVRDKLDHNKPFYYVLLTDGV